ncbi:hypothetical protein Agub_g3179 [Astrephomene gubernaculifera]|uniref:RHD domain-containing protein n=1 Tax=Astrephomene gubernaculifera TaxID=47775 RepID=A0AAD3DI48_9CHLO|nr:hypothetical protein Agub_g3179 [Astrephomene gubernaculifera]
MSSTDAPVHPGGVQYRLRFFHKCRLPGTCDHEQPDRYQVQGSAIESTCGAPLVVVLVRYKHDPESGLTKECRRAQLAPGKSQFAIKTVVVPSDRLLEYMQQPLLQQPSLTDPQGRNLLGGPDVSPDGCIYVTPLEENGIAPLDNFTFNLPWNDTTTNHCSTATDVNGCCTHKSLHRGEGESNNGGQAAAGLRGNCGAGGGGGGGGGMKADPGASTSTPRPQLCLLVQLLRRSTDQPGKWNVYGMPHLASRPFQVISRLTLLKLQRLQAMRTQQQQHHQLLQQQRQQQQHPGLVAQDPLRQQMRLGPQQQQQLGMTAGGGGGGGVRERRRSSYSSGSPHAAAGAAQRVSRPRRRSCLSKDTAHDDLPASAAALGLNPIRTRDGGVTPATDATPASTPMGVRTAPETSPGPLSPHSSGNSRLPPVPPRSPLAARSGTPVGSSMAGCGTLGVGAAGEVGSQLQQQRQHTPENRVAELNTAGLQDLLDGLAAQVLEDEDFMELSCPQKRVRSNVTLPDVAAFASGCSSSGLLSPAHTTTMFADQQLLARGGGMGSSVSAPLPVLSQHLTQQFLQQGQQYLSHRGGGSWSTENSAERLITLGGRQAVLGTLPGISSSGGLLLPRESGLLSPTSRAAAGLMVVGDGCDGGGAGEGASSAAVNGGDSASGHCITGGPMHGGPQQQQQQVVGDWVQQALQAMELETQLELEQQEQRGRQQQEGGGPQALGGQLGQQQQQQTEQERQGLGVLPTSLAGGGVQECQSSGAESMEV